MTPAQRAATALWVTAGGAAIVLVDGHGEHWLESLTSPGRWLAVLCWETSGGHGLARCAWCGIATWQRLGALFTPACGCGGPVAALDAWGLT